MGDGPTAHGRGACLAPNGRCTAPILKAPHLNGPFTTRAVGFSSVPTVYAVSVRFGLDAGSMM